MPIQLSFHYGSIPVDLAIDELFLVGYGGRNAAQVEAHIAELALLGMKRPHSTPCLYPVNPALLTQREEISVYGEDTVPEVEFVLFDLGGRKFVSVGNDQSDLEVERVLSAEKSKNLCMKSVAREVWALDEVADHWDDLRLQLLCRGKALQDGPVSELARPQTLFDIVTRDVGVNLGGRAIFSGTIPMAATVPPAPYDLQIRLTDPKRGKTIRHEFSVRRLGLLHGTEKAPAVSPSSH